MTFTKSAWVGALRKRVSARHVVSTVGLSSGDQNIPNGFLLTALCGCSDEANQLDLLDQYVDEEAEPCVICAKNLADLKRSGV